MLQSILQCAMQCGAFEKNMSLQHFTERVVQQQAVLESSIRKNDTGLCMLSGSGGDMRLIILSRHERTLDMFRGESLTEHQGGVTYYAMECPLDHGNAAALRTVLPWTAPSVPDGPRSFGFGDRIGGIAPATPWHAETIKSHDITPILAQQSVRENTKTGRTFQSVLDDATWSVLRVGYRKPWGADADHLKTLDEIDEAAEVGFTFFTIDPSDMIDNAADTDSEDVLSGKLAKMFGDSGELDDLLRRYDGAEGADRESVVRSVVKYYAAIRHGIASWQRLVEKRGEGNFAFEFSIDETETPTKHFDHRLIAEELHRAGVNAYSIAPRFVGRFEKGIDYIGDIDEFTAAFRRHVELSREFGGYRLSLHSGSDKFTVYPVFGEMTDGVYHVKTAGTSFLEAVKVIARHDAPLFSEIYALACDTFEENAASYDISGDVSRAPAPSETGKTNMVAAITTNNDLRQVLHIAFGVILKKHGDEFRESLCRHSGTYREYIMAHLGKHIALLTGSMS